MPEASKRKLPPPEDGKSTLVVYPEVAPAIPADTRPLSLRETILLAKDSHSICRHPAQTVAAAVPHHGTLNEHPVGVATVRLLWSGQEVESRLTARDCVGRHDETALRGDVGLTSAIGLNPAVAANTAGAWQSQTFETIPVQVV